MQENARGGIGLRDLIILICACLVLAQPTGAADTNASPAANTGAVTNAADAEGRREESLVISNQESLRSSLAIQEQLRNMQVAIEKQRKDMEEATARQTEMLESRLKLIEEASSDRQLKALEKLQYDNRLTLIGAGAFAVVGFVVLLFAAFVQWTAVSRINVLAAQFPKELMAGTNPAALGMGESGLLPSAADQSTLRMLGVLEKLEKRIDSIEKGGAPGLLEPAANGHEGANGGGDMATQQSASVALLMGKGQTLLKLDKPEEAIASFDQALAMAPKNTDVLVRKGAALERLQRMDEAIACYDLAIAADKTMTMAYLYKGGVYNRMERYTEALECYEAALKTQNKGPAANVVIQD